MRYEPVLPPPAPVAATVAGFQQSRQVARRRSARRRLKNSIVSGAMFALAAGAVGATAWVGYQFFLEDQASSGGDTVTVDQRSTSELIDHLERQPRWNGPGNPAFGVDTAP